MDVRLVRPTDAPLALTLALDDEAHLVKDPEWPVRNQVLRTVRQAVLPLCVPHRAWIAREGSSVALLEARPRRYVIGWDVARLAVRGDHSRLLAPLVEALSDHLRSRGVPRLFARCSEAAGDELKTVAFHPLAREYVLLGPERTVNTATPLPIDSRYRMPQDAWPLHQLESDVTPPLVRQMEGLASLEWSRRIRAMSEIVVEREGNIVCWVGWGVRVGLTLRQIGMLVHPQYREVAPALLQYVLETAPPGWRFVARVRDYQSEVLRVFLAAGFQITAEELLMVKHARVEVAPAARRLIQVAQIPTAHIFHHRARAVTSPRLAPAAGAGMALKDRYT